MPQHPSHRTSVLVQVLEWISRIPSRSKHLPPEKNRAPTVTSFPPDVASLVDSLQTLVGGDVGISFDSKLSRLMDASFALPIFNDIHLDKFGGDSRGTVGHEFGHIADFRNVLPKSVEKEVKSFATRIPKHEQFAKSFEMAVNALQNTRRLNVNTVDEAIETFGLQSDDVVMMRALLDTEVYEGHHFNAKRAKKK